MKKTLLLFAVLIVCDINIALSQTIEIQGIVIDEVGDPLMGVSVVIDTANRDEHIQVRGAITDENGIFKINAPQGTVLCFSYIGYNTQCIQAKREMIVTLVPATQQLGEVVITGMGNLDKRLFTGVSDQIRADDIKISGMADISRSLEGRSAGVSLQNISSTFGTAPKIRIRGATSILGNSTPLWVVDGVILEDVIEFSPNDLSSGDAVTLISSVISGLNPDDIESFNILKDGSATSIYGARAMAGVIVVTTKKGRAGQTRINYTGEFTTRLKPNYSDYNILNSQEQMGIYQEMFNKGWLNLSETMRAMNSGVYGKMYQLINQYDNLTGQFGLEYTSEAMNNYLRQAEYRNTNWFDELFSNSVVMNHSINLSTGTEKTSSYFSLSYMNDPGWYKRSKVQRYTFNANSTYNLLNNLSLFVLGNVSFRKQEAPGTLAQEIDEVFGVVDRKFDINPFYFATNTSRTMAANETYTRNYCSFNIFEELENNYIKMNVVDTKFQAELNWKIIKGLEFKSLGSFHYVSSSNQYFIKDESNQARAYREMSDATIRDNNPYLYTDPDQIASLPVSILPEGGIYEKREYKTESFTVRNTINWDKIFNNTHIINAYGGMEINSVKRTNDWFRGWGLQYDKGYTPFYDYLAFKKSSEDGTDYFTISNTRRNNAAFFAMTNYSYKGRYNITGTIRYEGTNRLGSATSARWLPTWNIGGAWNIHEESFFEFLSPALSHLNVKASYSLTADAGPDYISNSTHIIMNYQPWRPTASDKESGLEIQYLGNKDLTYEKKHEFNMGLSIGFLNNRINMESDIYWRNNYDLLGITNTQGVGGEIRKYANVADMKSQGVEFTISTHNITSKSFSWNTDLTFSWNKQKIKNLDSDANVMDLILGTGYNLEGYAPNSIFSIPFIGLDTDGFPMYEIGGKTITKDNYSDINFQSTEKIDLNSLKYEGPTDPKYTGGFGNIFTFKNFKLNIFATYGYGNVIRLNPVFAYSYTDFNTMTNEFKNRWMIPGDENLTNVPVIASVRQVNEIGSSSARMGYNAYNYSSARIAKANFIRMKEISLTYNFSPNLLRHTQLKNLLLKIQATNPFLIYAHSSLNGQDPEYYSSGGVSSPLAKQFTFTIQMGL